MRILTPFRQTKLYSCQPNDLIRIHYSGSTQLALFLKSADDGQIIGILSSENPFHIKLTRDFDCLKVPEGWEIELDDCDQFIPRNRRYLSSAGAIHVDDHGVYINFNSYTEDYANSEVTYFTSDNSFSDISQVATPYPS